MMLYSRFVLLLVGLFLLAGSILVIGEMDTQSKDASSQFKGVPSRSIMDMAKAIELHSNPVILIYRGDAYKQKGDYEPAIEDFTKAIKLSPDNVDGYIARGLIYMRKNDYDLAIADYTRAIALQPDQAIHYNFRGGAYMKKNDYDRAIIDYTNAIQRSQYTSYYGKRGEAYWEKGDYDHAIEDFTREVENIHSYNKGKYYTYRGILFSAKGDIAHAVEDFIKANELRTNDHFW